MNSGIQLRGVTQEQLLERKINPNRLFVASFWINLPVLILKSMLLTSDFLKKFCVSFYRKIKLTTAKNAPKACQKYFGTEGKNLSKM